MASDPSSMHHDAFQALQVSRELPPAFDPLTDPSPAIAGLGALGASTRVL